MPPNESDAANRWKWHWAVAFFLTRVIGAAIFILVLVIWPSTPIVALVMVGGVAGGAIHVLIGRQRGDRMRDRSRHRGEGDDRGG